MIPRCKLALYDDYEAGPDSKCRYCGIAAVLVILSSIILICNITEKWL